MPTKYYLIQEVDAANRVVNQVTVPLGYELPPMASLWGVNTTTRHALIKNLWANGVAFNYTLPTALLWCNTPTPSYWFKYLCQAASYSLVPSSLSVARAGGAPAGTYSFVAVNKTGGYDKSYIMLNATSPDLYTVTFKCVSHSTAGEGRRRPWLRPPSSTRRTP
jgi:hypothetical protein